MVAPKDPNELFDAAVRGVHAFGGEVNFPPDLSARGVGTLTCKITATIEPPELRMRQEVIVEPGEQPTVTVDVVTRRGDILVAEHGAAFYRPESEIRMEPRKADMASLYAVILAETAFKGLKQDEQPQ